MTLLNVQVTITFCLSIYLCYTEDRCPEGFDIWIKLSRRRLNKSVQLLWESSICQHDDEAQFILCQKPVELEQHLHGSERKKNKNGGIY